MFNGWVEMLSLYIRCSTDESKCYRCTRDVQPKSQDVITVNEMVTDESRCHHCILDIQRRSRDAIVVHEMFNGGVEMLLLYIRYSTEESRYVQRLSRDANVVHEIFNGGVEMLSLYMRCSKEESRCYRYSLDVQ
ncbi:hypothetical protein Tco_1024446 [Tanacetum coccineum]